MHVFKHGWCVFVVMAVVGFVGVSPGDEPEYVCVPLGSGPNGIFELTMPRVAGARATVEFRQTSGSPQLARISFDKSGQERRIVAVEGKPDKPVVGATVIAVSCRLGEQLKTPPQLVLLVFEHDGGAWYRLGRNVPSSDGFAEMRIPLGSEFSRCRFATDSDDDVRWDQVDRVWLGLLIDGPAEGNWEIRRAVFTDEPFRPSGPLALWGEWSVSHDADVHGEMASVNEGADSRPAMKYNFSMPGGRHMYAVPRLPVQVDELDSYSGLGFTYKAELPPGIAGLLVMLIEADGTQYYADPAPAAAADWTAVTIPFGKFRRGGWSPDENDQLDLDQVRGVAIGMHGTSQAAQASGQIMAAGVQFVP